MTTRARKFGPTHEGWSAALAIREKHGSCGMEVAAAWVRREYGLGWHAVSGAFERFDRGEHLVGQPRVRVPLVIDEGTMAAMRRKMIREGYPVVALEREERAAKRAADEREGRKRSRPGRIPIPPPGI
jgi:hypothetical protein